MNEEDGELNYAKIAGCIPVPSRLEAELVRKALSDSVSLMESMLYGGYRLDNNEAVEIMLRSCIEQSKNAIKYTPSGIDDAMVGRALQAFDTGTGDPNDYRSRMRAALEAVLSTSSST